MWTSLKHTNNYIMHKVNQDRVYMQVQVIITARDNYTIPLTTVHERIFRANCPVSTDHNIY